jgi:hypothetical protein
MHNYIKKNLKFNNKPKKELLNSYSKYITKRIKLPKRALVSF